MRNDNDIIFDLIALLNSVIKVNNGSLLSTAVIDAELCDACATKIKELIKLIE